jgi:hypothetical protein
MLLSPQTRIVTISNITPSLFEQLHLNYGQTLSCPCSTISVPYEAFVANTILSDPICTSIFVRRQWIEALYLDDASAYVENDFRVTASSQVSEDLWRRDISYHL